MQRLLERPDVVAGHPNFRGTLDGNEGSCDDRMRLIRTRRGFALWSPLPPDVDANAGVLPTMVDVTVRDLDGSCALTLERCMHPRTIANLMSMLATTLLFAGLATMSPASWVLALMAPIFLVLPVMSTHQAWRARERSRRAWDALTETFTPLELTRSSPWMPFRELPSQS